MAQAAAKLNKELITSTPQNAPARTNTLAKDQKIAERAALTTESQVPATLKLRTRDAMELEAEPRAPGSIGAHLVSEPAEAQTKRAREVMLEGAQLEAEGHSHTDKLTFGNHRQAHDTATTSA